MQAGRETEQRKEFTYWFDITSQYGAPGPLYNILQYGKTLLSSIFSSPTKSEAKLPMCHLPPSTPSWFIYYFLWEEASNPPGDLLKLLNQNDFLPLPFKVAPRTVFQPLRICCIKGRGINLFCREILCVPLSPILAMLKSGNKWGYSLRSFRTNKAKWNKCAGLQNTRKKIITAETFQLLFISCAYIGIPLP